MGLPLVLANESIAVDNIKILIYGQGGVGKTSLAFTSNKPILLDFDRGAHRSKFRNEAVVRPKRWEDIENDKKELLELVNDYETIIIDTADAMIDMWTAYAVKKKPKLRYNKFDYYDALLEFFTNFTQDLLSSGADIIILAHDKERDEGNVTLKFPDIAGALGRK
jgi:hypothetical protein